MSSVGRKVQCTLADLPAPVRNTFETHAHRVSLEGISDLRKQLIWKKKHIEELENERVNIRAMDWLYHCSNFLLDEYERLDKDQQALVVGAIQYFLLNTDPLPDTSSEHGFDDDILVMVSVVTVLGYDSLWEYRR